MTEFNDRGQVFVPYKMDDGFGNLLYLTGFGVAACLSDYFFDSDPALLPDESNEQFSTFRNPIFL